MNPRTDGQKEGKKGGRQERKKTKIKTKIKPSEERQNFCLTYKPTV